MKMDMQIKMINIENIIPNRFQPRLQFDQSELADLAASIKEHGIIQPLVLRAVNDKYEIIAGERRYKAATLAGLTEVPAIIANLDDNESAEVAIIENTHRKNLSPIEEAKSYKRLLERKYVTQDQLAKRLGTSQSNIANKVRLLSLDDSVQDALLNEKISERHARSLLKLNDKKTQSELLQKIINERWTVKLLDEEIERIQALSGRKVSFTGEIQTNNQLDIDINNIINNSNDIVFDSSDENKLTMEDFTQFGESKMPSKNSIFFNNLENEAVNMGFNPFQSTSISKKFLGNYDVLDFEEEPEEDEEKTEVKRIKIENKQDVINAIKDVVSEAKSGDIKIEIEEFDFDNINQFIIRIEK